jgi:hypothetical protein
MSKLANEHRRTIKMWGSGPTGSAPTGGLPEDLPVGQGDKPKSLQEYTAWLRNQHGVDTSGMKDHYEVVADRLEQQVKDSVFWNELTTKLKDFDEEYRLSHEGYDLISSYEPPDLLTKPFKSLLEKTYRINVVHNRYWPAVPNWRDKRRWILPDNWFSMVNDIVRARFVVQYFDGVKFLMEKFDAKFKQHTHDSHIAFESRDEGYYAGHFYMTQNLSIFTMRWETQVVPVDIELQVTTRMQDVIGQMIHEDYEERRLRPGRPSRDWRWNYQSPEFATNYLGHILHYLDGVIVETRDKRKEQGNGR